MLGRVCNFNQQHLIRLNIFSRRGKRSNATYVSILFHSFFSEHVSNMVKLICVIVLSSMLLATVESDGKYHCLTIKQKIVNIH